MIKLLIIDDDVEFSNLLSEILTDEGFFVASRPVPTKIIETIVELEPDLLLLDYWLPGERGDLVTKRLKKNPLTKGLPIIVISANHGVESVVKKAGANDFIPKPFDANTLIKKISQLTNKINKN